jgi:hypothetical protein
MAYRTVENPLYGCSYPSFILSLKSKYPMEPQQIQVILGIILILTIVSFFFKVTRKLAVFAIIGAFCLFIGFLAGVGASKEIIKKNNPVCFQVIYNK